MYCRCIALYYFLERLLYVPQCPICFLMCDLIPHNYSTNSDVRLKSQNSKEDQHSRNLLVQYGRFPSVPALRANENAAIRF